MFNWFKKKIDTTLATTLKQRVDLYTKWDGHVKTFRYTFRIDGGKVTTDTQTFRKIVDLCINNGIRLEFVNGSINTVN